MITDMLGTFEQMVLTAVLALRDEAYGLAIHAKATELAGRPMNVGSVYVTLDRLRKKGYLTSKLTEQIGRAHV